MDVLVVDRFTRRNLSVEVIRYGRCCLLSALLCSALCLFFLPSLLVCHAGPNSPVCLRPQRCPFAIHNPTRAAQPSAVQCSVVASSSVRGSIPSPSIHTHSQAAAAIAAPLVPLPFPSSSSASGPLAPPARSVCSLARLETQLSGCTCVRELNQWTNTSRRSVRARRCQWRWRWR